MLTAFAANNKDGWLPHGVVAVRTINEANLIAATDHRGYFVIGTQPLDGLGGRSALDVMTSALSKIKRGQPLDFHEEYGIESLWHEILHNSQRYRQPADINIRGDQPGMAHALSQIKDRQWADELTYRDVFTTEELERMK